MSDYKGYLLKFGDTVFPHKYLAQNPKFTPNQRTEAEAYRDANNDLHRITINNHKSKLEITTLDLDLDEKLEVETAMKRGLMNEVERKYTIEFWNDEENTYNQGDFYMTDTDYSPRKITDSTIFYDPITYTFVEY